MNCEEFEVLLADLRSEVLHSWQPPGGGLDAAGNRRVAAGPGGARWLPGACHAP